MDLKFCVTLSEEECWKRRQQRTYDPADPPGYFQVCIWPMAVKYEKFVKKNRHDVSKYRHLRAVAHYKCVS